MARSNRPLTQFAVGKIQEYLDLGPRRFISAGAGNTSVTLDQQGEVYILGVWLFDQPIAELFFVGDRFDCLNLADGGFYDKAGNPSRTTRERLNGILDKLGESCLIPEGVRVFIEEKKCYVGSGSTRQPFGKKLPDICINASPITLEFQQ